MAVIGTSRLGGSGASLCRDVALFASAVVAFHGMMNVAQGVDTSAGKREME